MPDPSVPTPLPSLSSCSHPLVERVYRSITRNHLLAPDARVVVGVSGGPDSLALLHILASLRLQHLPDLRLHVAHLDHGLRAQASAADAEAVAVLAASWALPATVARRNVEEYRRAGGLSWEQAAREVRYRFFAEVAQQVGADRVAVGHTADDQVETVLLHLLRGAGTLGLRGMLPAAPLPYATPDASLTLVRPLLDVTRQETVAYCTDLGLPVRWDASNQDPAYQRNRIRQELLPALETYNPQVRAALLRLSRQAGEDQAFIEGQLDHVWPHLARVEPEQVTLDVDAMALLPHALGRYAVRRALATLVGDLQGFALSHVEDVVAALDKSVGTQLTLPRGVHVTRGYRHATLSLHPVNDCPLPPWAGPRSVPVPGAVSLPGWEVRTGWETPDPSGAAAQEEDRWIARLDADAVQGALTLRARQPGDRFQPLGMEGTKKVQDFFVDARVPRAWRDRIPLLVAGADILWVVGWRVSQQARGTPATRRLLVVECRPEMRI